MGKYKDKNGTTKVGDFLRKAKDVGVKVAPSILELASNITGVDALGKLGDAIKGSDDLSPEMKAQALSLLEFDKAEMAEITKRHAADMASDSWLSKNVRPMVLIFSWLLVAILAISDSASTKFSMPEYYLNLIIPLFLTVNGFYFGARTLEKYHNNKFKS